MAFVKPNTVGIAIEGANSEASALPERYNQLYSGTASDQTRVVVERLAEPYRRLGAVVLYGRNIEQPGEFRVSLTRPGAEPTVWDVEHIWKPDGYFSPGDERVLDLTLPDLDEYGRQRRSVLMLTHQVHQLRVQGEATYELDTSPTVQARLAAEEVSSEVDVA